MSDALTILPIKDVPDELIRILNDRFRQLSQTAAATDAGSAAGLFFTHANRAAVNITPLGTYGAETDRGIVYQVRTAGSSKVWAYASGVMCATFANRPADLGTNDAGFQFLATDTYQEYRWSGSAWVETTQANDVQLAAASAPITLAAMADVTGATITLNRKGRYLILGTFDFQNIGDLGNELYGQCVADGTPLAGFAIFIFTSGYRATLSQQWTYTPAAAGKVVKLQAAKTGGGGTSVVNNIHTQITALWIGP